MLAKVKKILLWILGLSLLVPVICVALYYWVMLRPQPGPANSADLPLDYASFTNIVGWTDIPSTASHIYHSSARLSMGFAGARLYRFDARSRTVSSMQTCSYPETISHPAIVGSNNPRTSRPSPRRRIQSTKISCAGPTE